MLLAVCFVLFIATLPPAGRAAEGDEATNVAAESEPEAGDTAETPASEFTRREALIAALTIFVLAVFVGFEVITKVPPTLHTPLMSGSNAISGITIVGALVAAGGGQIGVASLLGMVAVALAAVNVVGGFLVTHRMLAMFQRKR